MFVISVGNFDDTHCLDLLQVDIAYIPFIERFQPFFLEVKNYDITRGRPKLALWIEVHLSLSLSQFGYTKDSL